jgi:hypothetical protein
VVGFKEMLPALAKITNIDKVLPHLGKIPGVQNIIPIIA